MAPPFLSSTIFFAFNAYRLVLPSFVLVFKCFAALFTHRDIILWLLLFCLQRLPFGLAVFCLNVRMLCRPFYSSRHHPMAPPFLPSSTLTVFNSSPHHLMAPPFFIFNAYRLVLPSFVFVSQCFAVLFTHRDIILWLLLFCLQRLPFGFVVFCLDVWMLCRPSYWSPHHPMVPPFLSSTLTVWFCRLLSWCLNALPPFLLIATSSYGSSFFVFNAYRLVLSSFVLMFECFAALLTDRHIILWFLLFCLQRLPFGFVVFCLGVRMLCRPFYSSRHHPMAPPFLPSSTLTVFNSSRYHHMAPPFSSSTLTVWFCRLLSWCSNALPPFFSSWRRDFLLITTSSYGSSFFVFNAYRLVLSSFVLVFECFAALFTDRDIILWLLLFCLQRFFLFFNAYRLVLPSFVLVFECFAALFTHRDIILWLFLFLSSTIVLSSALLSPPMQFIAQLLFFIHRIKRTLLALASPAPIISILFFHPNAFPRLVFRLSFAFFLVFQYFEITS